MLLEWLCMCFSGRLVSAVEGRETSHFFFMETALLNGYNKQALIFFVCVNLTI